MMTTVRAGGLLILLLTAREVGADAPRADALRADAPAAAAIRRLLDGQVDAWNRKDLEGFMAAYLNSPTLTFFSGANRTEGWAATLARYRARYQGDGQEMGKLSFESLRIDPLAADVALARGAWQLKFSTKKETGGLFTLVLRKGSEGWRIVHDHTSQ